MAETGIARFPGSLDPRAEEFRPRNPSSISNQVVLFRPPPPPPPPPQVYYQYASPYPPISEVQVLPFCDGGLGYQQFTTSPGYVSSAAVAVRLPVPPPSAASTRALLLSSVPSEMSESMVRKELEAFGEVRGVQMERVHDGIVTVHFYDLRHAENALKEIREQHMQLQTGLRNHYTSLLMRNCGPDDHNWAALPAPPARGLITGHAVWAQFIIPASNSVPDGHNQGTIVIFNLDSEVTASTLKDIFQAFGPIKELRETPSKKHQKFVEFFDVRDAAKALKEMNGKEINGKAVVIEFSRPGGQSRKIINAATTNPTISASFAAMNSTNGPYARTCKYPSPPSPSIPPQFPRKFSGRPSFNVNIPPRSYASQTQFPARKPNFGKGSANGNGNKCSSSSVLSVERNMASLNLGSSLCNGTEEIRDSHGPPKRFTRKNHNGTQPTLTSNHQTSPPPPQQQQPPAPAPPRSSRSRKGGRHAKKFDSRFLISEDAMTESNCRDTRTTVMIKNIPNKYSQKLLLNMLDNHCIHCNEQIADGRNDQPFSSYDFVYLPIDFNNKCNVGYGFVNMTSPEATWRLYKAFHLQHWEVFNSRKICEVTYARVQGLEALKEHFKNSKFPCEMDHYLPVVFSPPRDGRELTEPLPIVGPNKQRQEQPISIIGPAIEAAASDCNGDHYDDEMDGPDGLENANDGSVDDDVDQVHHDDRLLLRGDNSISSSSQNGGIATDDDDDDVEEDRQRC